MIKKIGIYVHIPFCKKKCLYCDFCSVKENKEQIENYIKAILLEIEIKAEKMRGEKDQYVIDTIYIGGGTPSIIDSRNIKKILKKIRDNFEIEENAEITIEANPGTTSLEKFKAYREAGINRVSIGLQSSNDELLKTIGRIHTNAEFLTSVRQAMTAGFNNINADVMIGLPNQTIYDVENTLNELIELNLQHISVYSLIVEEGTPIEKLVASKKLELPDEEIERYMYWFAKRKLEENRYMHYEISNFSKIEFRSKHNVNCWNQNAYVGFGAAACSYDGNVRYKNTDNIDRYIKNLLKNEEYKNTIIEEVQTRDAKMNEYMILGLRKINGINMDKFREKFGTTPLYKYNKEITKLLREDLIIVDTNNIRLSKKGLDFANLVWEEFV